MLRKQSGDGLDAEEGYYGYGMWIIDNPNGRDYAYFQGCDPGISFISEYHGQGKEEKDTPAGNRRRAGCSVSRGFCGEFSCGQEHGAYGIRCCG